MGCELAKHSVVVIAPEEIEDDDGGRFTETQIDTIRSTWPLLAGDYIRVGIEVFTRIFNEMPSVRVLFHSFGFTDADNLESHPLFREHAQKFMHVLESLVENLETPEVIQPHLVALGARHAAIDGYDPEYFRFYSKCLLEVWEMELGEEFIIEVKECWRQLIGYIVRCMVHGYHICRTDQLESFVKETQKEKIEPT
ncbi:cytoglobin-2-like [Physella acuta]|uniref:cytoglobin-2-like n=1 Tax=Physella acuta TaxID=109671 RepID=UPI0027DB5F2A|nr:cytoglobin-2-like [Physella acuta]